MERDEFKRLLSELMERYDEYRAKWVADFGSEDGFNRWFTRKVTNR